MNLKFQCRTSRFSICLPFEMNITLRIICLPIFIAIFVHKHGKKTSYILLKKIPSMLGSIVNYIHYYVYLILQTLLHISENIYPLKVLISFTIVALAITPSFIAPMSSTYCFSQVTWIQSILISMSG